jgi:hypothetical protein
MMATATELLRAGRRDEIWKKYCGFLDLDLAGYMRMQDDLLAEQIGRLGRCEMGREVMGCTPASVEEFRERVPITTYKQFDAYLSPKREETLPEKPMAWTHTSGRSGEYEYKWIPYTRKMYEMHGENSLSAFLLAMARKKGEVRLYEGMSFLYTVAPPPYVSGLFTDGLMEQFPFSVFPPPEVAKAMDYQERVKEAFRLALSEGLDLFYGVTSILLRIGEQFSQGRSGSSGPMPKLSGKAVLRLAGAAIKAFLAGRRIQPRDIWKVKGALCGGMDTAILKDKITATWGIEPTEAYGSTEFGAGATQAWNRRWFTFFPNVNYWEFMAPEDFPKIRKDPGYHPKVYRMDEVEADKDYALLGTNLHGGALVRYAIGDMFRVTALEDREAGIKLPQFTFVARIDDLIDIGGFTRLTETIIWRAIENAGFPYTDWSVRKENQGDKPILRLYIELKGTAEAEDVARAVHERLKELDEPYRQLETMAGITPMVVTLLTPGTYRRYIEERQAAGADLAHLKPPHMNSGESVIANLLRMSAWRI